MQNRLSVITFNMEIIFLFPFWILNNNYIILFQRTKPRITILYMFQLLNKICLYKNNIY